MNSRPLISVVIPVYNVEKYLAKCVDSVINQTYSNLQIILVDDGSPDSCGSICDSYKEKDPRIVVIHKANGGLSDARNHGIRVARGEFISFVDSDDYLSPIFIESLHYANKKNNTRISAVPGGTDFYGEDDVSLVHDRDELEGRMHAISATDCQKKLLYQVIDTGAPFRLYAKEVIDPDMFPVGLYYEDLATVYKIIRKTDRVSIVDSRGLYAYRQRETSIIRQVYSPHKANSAIIISKQLYSDIRTWYPELESAACSRCFSVNRMVFAQTPSNAKEDRLRIWQELCLYKNTIVKDRDARKRERIAAFIACIGKKPFIWFCEACRKWGLLK